MTRDLMQGAGELMQSPRTAATVSGSTIVAWLGDAFTLIPWGDVAACISAVLSLVLIVVQVRKSILDSRRLRIQIELLEAEKRKTAGDGG